MLKRKIDEASGNLNDYTFCEWTYRTDTEKLHLRSWIQRSYR